LPVAATGQGDPLRQHHAYGPPGCGKTSLAEVIAAETRSRFVAVNAVMSNVAELREILRWARTRPEDRLLLFIDEIHRFNKAQQDLLLPDVEAGHLRLIGATTHNPGHYVNAPLLSRSHLFRLEPVGIDAVAEVLRRAMADAERGLAATRVEVDPQVIEGVARLSDGDLRRALNALETLVLSMPMGGRVDVGDLETFARERQIRYDADEDEHYDTVSAFIKSVRGSDPDAALYWLAKMVVGGEDPRFIARRLVILASEDVGLADSRGIGVAVAAQQAVEFIGMPRRSIRSPTQRFSWHSRPRATASAPPSARPRKPCATNPSSPCRSGCATHRPRPPKAWATARATCTATSSPRASLGRSTCSSRCPSTKAATPARKTPCSSASNASRP
jgi:putative ATPase